MITSAIAGRPRTWFVPRASRTASRSNRLGRNEVSLSRQASSSIPSSSSGDAAPAGMTDARRGERALGWSGSFLAPFLARLFSDGRQTSGGWVELVAVDDVWKPVGFTELHPVAFGQCDYLSYVGGCGCADEL